MYDKWQGKTHQPIDRDLIQHGRGRGKKNAFPILNEIAFGIEMLKRDLIVALILVCQDMVTAID
jgi:hypothetical protein